MKVLANLLAIGLAAAAFGQQWTKIATNPTSRNLNGVAFLDSNKGMIVGDYKSFFLTSDGGATWQAANAAPVSSVQSAFWLDAQRGWVVGSDGPNDSFRTTDGGQTWTRMAGMPFGSYYAVTFKTPLFGHTVSNGGATITRDGGATWQSTTYNAMSFLDDQTGLAWNDNGIYRTTNGGSSWTRQSTQSAYPFWISSTTALASGGGGVYRSTNAGQTWTQVSALSGYGSPTVLSPSKIVCWNNFGNTIHSTDGGSTWSAVDGQCPKGIVSASKVDATTMCAISATGDIYRSANVGASWQLVQAGQGVGPVSWNIQFPNSTVGYAVGQYGIILRTDNGGISWRTINNGTGDEVVALKKGSAGLLYKASRGHVDRSLDGGNFWLTQRVQNFGQVFGHDETIQDADFDKNSGFGVAAGFGGTIFRTIDNGVTWQSVGYPAISEGVYFYSVKVIDSHTAFAGAQDFDELDHTKSLYKTTDAGLTWQMVFPSGLRWIKIEFTDPLHGMMLNLGALVYRTSDGGQTWQTGQLTGSRFTNLDLSMASTNVAYMSGWDGYIAKTTDGGATWNQLPTNTTSAKFMDIEAASETEVWAIGQETNGNYLWHSVNGGQTWTRELIPSFGIEAFYLSEMLIMADSSLLLGGFDGALLKRSDVSQVAPTNFTMIRGTLVSGGLGELINSDDQRLKIGPGVVITSSEAPINVEFTAVSPTASPSSLSFSVEGQANNPNLQQAIELFDYAANAWVSLDLRLLSINSDNTVTVVGSNPSRFVRSGTREVKARIRTKAVGPLATYPYQQRIDRVSWSIRP